MVSESVSTSLDCREAFLIEEAFEHDALHVAPNVEIARHYEIARGEESPRASITFRQEGGRHLYDIVGTGYATLKILSGRAVDVLRENGFTGWRTFDVTIVLSDRSVRADYRGLSVTGRCGPIDPRLSEPIVLPPLAPGGMVVPGLRGMCFDPRSWDGSDVFTPQGYAGIMVVERVRDALIQARITNMVVTCAAEVEQTVLDADDLSSSRYFDGAIRGPDPH